MEFNLNRTNLNQNLDIILSSIQIEELNVYNQAYLMLSTPLIKTSSRREKSIHEQLVSFPLSGDLNGKVDCFIDMYQKSLNEQDLKLLQNLFSESMNILLGQMLTNIEKTSHYNIMLGLPLKVNRNSQVSNYKSQDMYNVGYKLIFAGQEYNCRMIFLINKTNRIEV